MFTTTIHRFRNIYDAVEYLCKLYKTDVENLPITYEWNSDAQDLYDDEYKNLVISRLFEPLLLERGRVTMPCRKSIHFKRELILEQDEKFTTIINSDGKEKMGFSVRIKKAAMDFLSGCVPCKLVFTPGDNSLWSFMEFSRFDNERKRNIMDAFLRCGVFKQILYKGMHYTRHGYTEYKIFDGQNLLALYYYQRGHPFGWLLGASISSPSRYINLNDNDYPYELIQVNRIINPSRLMEMFFKPYHMIMTPEYQLQPNESSGIPQHIYRRYIDNSDRRIVIRRGRVIGYYDKDKRWFSLA